MPQVAKSWVLSSFFFLFFCICLSALVSWDYGHSAVFFFLFHGLSFFCDISLLKVCVPPRRIITGYQNTLTYCHEAVTIQSPLIFLEVFQESFFLLGGSWCEVDCSLCFDVTSYVFSYLDTVYHVTVLAHDVSICKENKFFLLISPPF